jgi:hypothetical protein
MFVFHGPASCRPQHIIADFSFLISDSSRERPCPLIQYHKEYGLSTAPRGPGDLTERGVERKISIIFEAGYPARLGNQQ